MQVKQNFLGNLFFKYMFTLQWNYDGTVVAIYLSNHFMGFKLIAVIQIWPRVSAHK